MTPYVNRRIRHGFSLLELLVVLTTGSVLMVSAVAIVHQALTLATISKARADDDRTATRLADQFRNDVYLAVAADFESPDLLRLSFADAEDITYQMRNHTILRTQILSDDNTHREEFAFENAMTGKFTLLSNPDRVELQLQRQLQTKVDTVQVDRQIQPVIGRWSKLLVQEAVQ